MLKFSSANAKIVNLGKVKELKRYLAGNRKVYSFDLRSGHTCPYAKDCRSSAVEQPDGSLKIVDGPHTDFRCFSASQEALFKNVYKLRKANEDILVVAAVSISEAATRLSDSLPKNAGIVRIHVGGDFKTRNYFEAWMEVARRHPDVLFYAYTKSLPFWVKNLEALKAIPNFVLTASRGGYRDDLIAKHNLREAIVVPSVYRARKLKLKIDHDDSHAANPAAASFALLVHGPQRKGSKWGKAVKRLKGKGSYRRK